MRAITALMLILALSLPSVAKTRAEKRADIRDMRDETLEELFEDRPQAQKMIQDAAGYAVFSNVAVTALFLTAGGGKGMAHDNASGKDTFMKMGTGGVGIGLGAKNFRAIFIFHEREAFDYFVDKGWDFSGSADAAAEIDDIGGDLSEGANISKKVTVYQYTEDGLALTATLNGTKYWKDKKLNRGE